MTIDNETFKMWDKAVKDMIKANMSLEDVLEERLRKQRMLKKIEEERAFTAKLIAEMDEQIALQKEKELKKEQELMENRKVTLNLDMQENDSKPVKKEIGAIQKRIGASKVTIEVRELAAWLNEGATMKAAALNGNKNSDWESQEVFALDFDNAEEDIKKYGYMTIEKALERCKLYNLTPSFYYTSFSSTEEKVKFRLVFITDVKITDIRVRNVVQIALMNIFPESDKACKDLSRIFFGSNKGCTILAPNASISILDTVQSMLSYINATDAINASRVVKTYCQTVGLNMVNGVPDITIIDKEEKRDEIEETTPSSIIYYIEQGAKSSKTIKTIRFNFNIQSTEYSVRVCNTEGKKKGPKCDIENVKIKAGKLIEGFDFDALESKCELYSDFVSGARWCYHKEVFGMATNLWRFNQGQSRLIEAIESNNDYVDTYNKINTITQASKGQYEPMRCSNFCPYCNKCSNTGLNMLHSVEAKRNEIRLIEEIETKDLETAYEETAEAITEAIVNPQNKITVIVGATGIGKSTMLNTLAKEDREFFINTVVAAPSHKLLDELVEKMTPVLPNLVHVSEPQIEDVEVLNKYRAFKTTGQYAAANGVLTEYVNTLLVESKNNAEERIEANKIIKSINEYIRASKEARATSKPVFCTHKRLSVLNNSNVEKYIVDEDIISTVIQNITITDNVRTDIANAAIMANSLKLKDLYTHFTSFLEFLNELELTNNVVVEYKAKLKAFSIKDIAKLLDAYAPTCNIVDILSIKAAIKASNGVITAYKNNSLPNKPIIVLSATANEAVYKAVFNDREVEFINVGNIETEGDVVLHYAGMSRTYLNKNLDKAIAKVKEEAPGVKNIITYKSFSSKFKKEGFNPICTYGNCTGIDAYGGQDLIVVGTPHVNMAVYLLLAHACNVRENIVLDMEFVNTKRNGYEFSFSTFNSHNLSATAELIREIQFYLIESELIQAVGRARTLRKNCTVHLFSNLPLRGCKLYR